MLCPNDVANFCSNLLFLFGGFDRAQMNTTLLQEVVKVSVDWFMWILLDIAMHSLPTMIKSTPAGASTKMVAQYFQNAKVGKFQKFDFGRRRNMKVCLGSI